MLIRAEEEKDWAAVHALNAAAFETPAEADLVEALRIQAHPVVSLVAEHAGAVVGYILFSPVTLSGHTDLARDSHTVIAQSADPLALTQRLEDLAAKQHENSGPAILGLAPMAVAPSHQRQGIGSALVRAGLERCRALGSGAVVVLGHPAYYPRFGFSPSVHFGIRSEYEVPEEAFMVLELQPGFLRGISGTVQYHAAFAKV